ncbi:MAG: hypothetical protein ACKOXB_08375 [Flavobacteriales bacterium]
MNLVKILEHPLLIFPAIIMLSWIFIFFIVSLFGWSALAKRYRLNKLFEGDHLGFVSLATGRMNYKNCIVANYNEEGMALRPIRLLSAAHSTVLIPWSEIKEIKDLGSYKELTIGEPEMAKLKLPGSLYEEIEPFYELHRIIKM